MSLRAPLAALAVSVAALTPAYAQQDAAAPATPKAAAKAPADSQAAAKAAESYSIGAVFGAQMREKGITPADLSTERFQAGVHDALTGKAKLGPKDKDNIDSLVKRAQDRALETNHKAAAAFLAENGKKPGVQTTASGLEYKVEKEGSGDSPKPADQVVVNYRGSLLDGTEFDSSYKTGQPATFPVSRVIPGWTEALQLMKPGGKYQLFIPPQLAYDAHSPPGIPPGSLLLFDVELLRVQPPTAPAAVPGPAPGAPPAGK